MAMVAEQFERRKKQLSVDRQGSGGPENNILGDVYGSYLSTMDTNLSSNNFSLLEDIPGLFL